MMWFNVANALLLLNLMPSVSGKFFQVGEGPCARVADDLGTVVANADNRDKCLNDCLKETTVQPCAAFEFNPDTSICTVFTEISNVSNFVVEDVVNNLLDVLGEDLAGKADELSAILGIDVDIPNISNISNISNVTTSNSSSNVSSDGGSNISLLLDVALAAADNDSDINFSDGSSNTSESANASTRRLTVLDLTDLVIASNFTSGECFEKEFVPFFRSKMPLVVMMVAGVFALHLAFFIKCCADQIAKYRVNLDRRKKKLGSSNTRIVFNRKGQVVKEQFVNDAELQQFGHILALLRTLGAGTALGNAMLFKYHETIVRAMEVADRCKHPVRKFLRMAKEGDMSMIGTFDSAEKLLTELEERTAPSGDVETVLDDFCQEIAVLYAVFVEEEFDDVNTALAAAFGVKKLDEAFGKKGRFNTKRTGMSFFSRRSSTGFFSSKIFGSFFGEPAEDSHARPASQQQSENPKVQALLARAQEAKDAYVSMSTTAKAESLEPVGRVNGVFCRDKHSLLSSAVDFRDMFGIGSKRLLGAVAILALSGPVRFVGTVAAVFLLIVLLGVAGMDFLKAREMWNHRSRSEQWNKRFRDALLTRGSALVFAGILILILLYALGIYVSQSNEELENRSTFLPVPPQYDLAKINGQDVYVSVIFSIMHVNLTVLILLPLPIAYAFQVGFVRRFPRLRVLVPQNPVWLHRTLGYMLIVGISFTGMIWIIFQGFECYTRKTIQTCEAFDPETLAGIDVYVLRFHIVYPLLFFMIPLMIYSKYPGPLALSEKRKEVRTDGADIEIAGRAAAVPAAAGAPAAPGQTQPPKKSNGQSCWSSLPSIVYGGMTALIPWIIVLAGCIHTFAQNFNIFFPFWFMILIPLTLHSFFQLRDWLAGSRFGERFGLRKGSEMAELVRKSWWEIAYASHVFAFAIMAYFAIFYRFEVFFPMLSTWGLYFVDRVVIYFKAYKYRFTIKVDGSNSSYAVNQGSGANAQPSHVRLVLRKPPGFQYKAGQWCHVAVPDAGAYFGCPSLALPFMQWHAFSIASKESDDWLEFHIRAYSSGELLENNCSVKASKTERSSFVKLARRGRWLDWLCPHRVPFIGLGKSGSNPSKSAAIRMGEAPVNGYFTAENAGLFVNLTNDEGASLKISKPQLQFTGRLWNTVQWLVEEHGRTGEAPEQRVFIMGPYGTLPWTLSSHPAVMLIGAGVGYPSTGAMLRQTLEDNLKLPDHQQKRVCFMWTASKVDQLLLCFPSLLVDLTTYVHARGLDSLKSWLHVKIFISSFEAGDVLSVNPDKALFLEDAEMSKPLQEVRRWLLGADVAGDGEASDQIDEDGTYIAQGSLGSSFSNILQKSLFTRQTVERGESMGVLFCGPPELSSWIRSDVANTTLPVQIEFQAEVAA
jgi:NAD(P)H-flavin reductase